MIENVSFIPQGKKGLESSEWFDLPANGFRTGTTSDSQLNSKVNGYS